MVYAGAVSSLEGVDVLIRSMEHVGHRVPAARLVVAGPVLERDPIIGRPLDYAQLVDALRLGVSSPRRRAADP